MKLYTITYDCNTPTVQRLNIPTNTDYKVGVKIVKDGEVLDIDPEDMTLGATTADAEKLNGYVTFTKSTGAEANYWQGVLTIDADDLKTTFKLIINVYNSQMGDIGGGGSGGGVTEEWVENYVTAETSAFITEIPTNLSVSTLSVSGITMSQAGITVPSSMNTHLMGGIWADGGYSSLNGDYYTEHGDIYAIDGDIRAYEGSVIASKYKIEAGTSAPAISVTLPEDSSATVLEIDNVPILSTDGCDGLVFSGVESIKADGLLHGGELGVDGPASIAGMTYIGSDGPNGITMSGGGTNYGPSLKMGGTALSAGAALSCANNHGYLILDGQSFGASDIGGGGGSVPSDLSVSTISAWNGETDSSLIKVTEVTPAAINFVDGCGDASITYDSDSGFVFSEPLILPNYKQIVFKDGGGNTAILDYFSVTQLLALLNG